MATTAPAASAILDHPDFRSNTHSTKWVEDTLDLTGVRGGGTAEAPAADEPPQPRSMGVEVNGKRFDVAMWGPSQSPGGPPRRTVAAAGGGAGAGTGQVAVPMQGTVVKVSVGVGDAVEAGDTVLVLEAMKMENNIAADVSGTVSEIRVAEGDSVGGGDIVVVIAPEDS